MSRGADFHHSHDLKECEILHKVWQNGDNSLKEFLRRSPAHLPALDLVFQLDLVFNRLLYYRAEQVQNPKQILCLIHMQHPQHMPGNLIIQLRVLIPESLHGQPCLDQVLMPHSGHPLLDFLEGLLDPGVKLPVVLPLAVFLAQLVEGGD